MSAPAWVYFWMSFSYWGQNQPNLIRWNNSFLSCRLEVDVDKIIIHEFRKHPEKYKESNFDIALLKLAVEVDITVYTPVCLPVLGQDYVSPDKQGNLRWATAAGKIGDKWVLVSRLNVLRLLFLFHSCIQLICIPWDERWQKSHSLSCQKCQKSRIICFAKNV